MKRYYSVAGVVTASLLLGACATPPMGPQVQVLPAQGKPFEVFQQDDAVCRQYASAQVGGQAERANNQAVGAAVLGTVLGAGLGAAAGGGEGAAIGAGAGAVAGTAYGASGSTYAQGGIQHQYDIAYEQCMYSHGNQVPSYHSAPPRAYNNPPPGYGQPPGYGPPSGYGAPPPGY
jgi:uncharacterized protein YcfJ